MKWISAVLLFIAGFVVGKPAEKYTDQFDNVNVDEILKNKRVLNSYVSCLLDEGNCTPDAAELKRVLPDALETECSKCSDLHKNRAHKVLKYLLDNEPEVFKKMQKHFDPNDVYKKKYRDLAKKEGYEISS